MNDKTRVKAAGIKSAIIVDDGYDEIPQIDELLDEGGWDSFFDDSQGAEATRIEAFFPDFDPGAREYLKSDQEFINALWQNRKTVRDLLGGLFDIYEQKAADNAPFLEAAEAALNALGIPYTTHGRDFVGAAVAADLILIDLFLGIQQGADDRRLTVDRLKQVIDDRRGGSLPSIILMSQIPKIDALAKEFRSDVQLHASAFRYVRKPDLQTLELVRGLILTLAVHRGASQALSTFVETWEQKAKKAAEKAASALRKIDIDDLQHIRTMLLRFEGVNTSSYMLDVFDRVLQYEVEAHSEVLEAAVPLDEMADDPPPLMISNDRDTYAILERTLFVNPNRRSHATGAVWPITFGDILGPRPGSTIKPRGFFSVRNDLVFFVASPECDLVRKDGLKTVLLVAGSLEEIDLAKPVLGVSGNTTPVLSIDGARRYQVTWDFGDLRTINLSQAKNLLKANGDAVVLGRLRDVPALGLRQQLLGNVGRVGEMVPLPRSFRFSAEIHYARQDGTAQRLALPVGVALRGNVLVPRKAKSATLIFDSSCENDLTTAILGLDVTMVSDGSKDLLDKLKKPTRLRKLFRSGFQWINLPLKNPQPAELLKDGEPLPEKDDKKPKVEKVGMIVTGPDSVEQLGAEFRKSGLVFKISVEDGV